MNKEKKQWPFLFIPLSIIIILFSSSLYLKEVFFSKQVPELTIYKVIVSPDKKYKAIYYNIDEGMTVKNYDHISIKNSSINLDNIDDFMPYSDRILSIDNNHSQIDFYWESNSNLVINYDFELVDTINIKESVFTKLTYTTNNQTDLININYIDKK